MKTRPRITAASAKIVFFMVRFLLDQLGRNATRFGALPTWALLSDFILPSLGTSTRCNVPSPILLNRTLPVPGIGSMQHGLGLVLNPLPAEFVKFLLEPF